MNHRSAALAGVAALSISACAGTIDASGPDGDSAPASSTSPTVVTPTTVGGMTDCTKAALAEASTAAARSLGEDNVYEIEDLLCAGGWAVTSGILADKRNPGTGAPTSFVFEQEGQFWVLQDKRRVCGTLPTTTVAPADAAIPAELFIAGCAAG